MKLGKIRKLLGMILAVGLMSSNVFAGEIVSSEETGVSDGGSLVSEEASSTIFKEADERSDDEKITYLRTYGQAVGQSVTKDNVKITVESVLADAYTWQMLICVETADGTAFKGDGDNIWVRGLNLVDKRELEIEEQRKKLLEALPEDADLMDYLKIEAQFSEEFKAALEKYTKEDGTLDMEGFEKYISEEASWGSASSGYGMGNNNQNTANKKYLIYHGGTSKEMGNEWVLRIQRVTQQEEVTYDITKSIITYLEAHKDEKIETEPLEITDKEKERVEELKLKDPEWYEERKAELENRPKYILAQKNLGLRIVPEDADYSIDNIGFIDNQFHICFKGDSQQRYNLELSSKDEDWVMGIYDAYHVTNNEDEKEEVVDYRAYDIKDIADLKNYTLKLSTTKVLEETTEIPDIMLTLKPFSEPKVIEVGKELSYYGDKKVTLQEVSIGEHSLRLHFRDTERDNEVVREMQVKLKDGKCKALRSTAGYGNATQETKVYALGEIKPEEIVSILWRDQEIALNK